MRPNASTSLFLVIFAALVVASVALKGAAGLANDGADSGFDQIERQIVRTLDTQGFTTDVRRFRYRSALVVARRGQCHVAARDARGGAAYNAVFAEDAAPFGPVRYLFADRSYGSPPAVRLRVARLATEVRTRLGFHPTVPVPVAIASNAACGDQDFGLGALRLAV